MHNVTMAQLYPVIEETLQRGGSVTLTPTGASMMPMLRHQRDTVTLGTIDGPLKINDVVLYKRNNGEFVLHRIVGMEKNGDFIMCGDYQLVPEHHIKQQQMIGRLLSFTRKGRHVLCSCFSYRAYVCLLPVFRTLRKVFGRNMIRMVCKSIIR